jgi:hypothetical protein
VTPSQHGGEAGAAIDGISAAHSRVIELCHQLGAEPARLANEADCLALPTVAVFVRAYVGRASWSVSTKHLSRVNGIRSQNRNLRRVESEEAPR